MRLPSGELRENCVASTALFNCKKVQVKSVWNLQKKINGSVINFSILPFERENFLIFEENSCKFTPKLEEFAIKVEELAWKTQEFSTKVYFKGRSYQENYLYLQNIEGIFLLKVYFWPSVLLS
jgi:hypothetical protein